jgi:DNA polymerase-3 subunit gamma/tau
LHVSLYRRYRPRLFSEVVGQDAAIGLLRSSFVGGRLGHAYLFSGPRGCGKTTAARLLAKAVNCAAPSPEGEPCCACDSCGAVASGDHMDVMEIDGASNRGIDQIRELKSHVSLASFMGGMKVYILDEVHMLTMEAFNALLKTLEEPPPSVMFIFATTEPHKVPVTIRSRCQHVPFHRISTELMAGHLRRVAQAEGFSAEDAALWEIARNADGALRDALSLAEQALAIGGGALTSLAVQGLLGGGSRAEMERWLRELRTSPEDASGTLKSMLDRGVSPERFLDALFPLLRDMWAYGLWGEKSFAGASVSEDERSFLREEVPNWSAEALKRTALAVAGMFQRARLGMKSDVFSGLLLFEMLSAFDPSPEPPRIEPRPSGALTERVSRPSDPLPPPSGERVSAAFLPAAKEPPGEAPRGEDHAPWDRELPEALAALCREDIALAAALIDVKVYRERNSLRLDFSDASQAARVALTPNRALAAVERAFGLMPAEADAEDSRDAAALRRPVDAEGARRSSYAEEISSRLGADILLSKRLGPEDGIGADAPDMTDTEIEV